MNTDYLTKRLSDKALKPLFWLGAVSYSCGLFTTEPQSKPNTFLFFLCGGQKYF
jgi:hypothetical protein